MHHYSLALGSYSYSTPAYCVGTLIVLKCLTVDCSAALSLSLCPADSLSDVSMEQKRAYQPLLKSVPWVLASFAMFGGLAVHHQQSYFDSVTMTALLLKVYRVCCTKFSGWLSVIIITLLLEAEGDVMESVMSAMVM